MNEIKGNIITNVKAVINTFTQLQKHRKSEKSGKVGQVKEFPFLIAGGFYNTIEGCVLSWCPKDLEEAAEGAFNRLPGELRHSLEFTPENGEFIIRAKLWKSILRPVMSPQQYHVAMGRILHWYVHIKQMQKEDGGM